MKNIEQGTPSHEGLPDLSFEILYSLFDI